MPIQTIGMLAKQRLRSGGNTHQLAAKRCQVQIRLQDFFFSPAPLNLQRQPGLIDFLRPTAAVAAACQTRIDQTGQLHRQCAGAPLFLAGDSPQRGTGNRCPIDAGVFVKTLVLGLHDQLAQCV